MCDPVVVRIWNQTSGEKACRGEGGGGEEPLDSPARTAIVS